uniref:Uncharacterized protein n=1 Tax=Heliothis virescens TaxID=7102 RepID=A0A2A4JBV7_HELVI
MLSLSQMAPMTAAEKQKNYRNRLKTQNPEKYHTLQTKAKERSARYYEKKKSTYTEEEKQKLRQKWKEDREKAKNAKALLQNESDIGKPNSNIDNNRLTNMQRRIEYSLKQETGELRSKLNRLSKGFQNLQKKLMRQQQKINEMQADYKNILNRLAMTEETNDTRQEQEKTPRKEITEFINNNLPNII